MASSDYYFPAAAFAACLLAPFVSAAPPANTTHVDQQRPVFRIGVDVVLVNFYRAG